MRVVSQGSNPGLKLMCLPTVKTSTAWSFYLHHGNTPKRITNYNCCFLTEVKTSKKKRASSLFVRGDLSSIMDDHLGSLLQSRERQIPCLSSPNATSALPSSQSTYSPSYTWIMVIFGLQLQLSVITTYRLFHCYKCNTSTGTSKTKDGFSTIAFPAHCNQSAITSAS